MTRDSHIAERRRLARQIVAHEATLRPLTSGNGSDGNPVIERLAPQLTPWVGEVGFHALLARALVLAQREAEVLRDVRVKSDCTIEGYSSEAAGANDVLLGNIIGLLTTSIGRTLTIRLLQNAWPELAALRQVPEEGTNYE